MISKETINYIITICKQYIDDVLRGWGVSKEEKELVAFEKEHMPYTKYSGNQSIDHVLFRKFIRFLNSLYKIDLGELLLDVDSRTKKLEVIKQDATDDSLATENKTIVGAINEILEGQSDVEIDTSNLMNKDGSNYVGDLALVSPTITSSWVVKDQSGNQVSTSSENTLSVENGAKVDYSGKFKYTAPTSAQKAPTRVEGSFGTTLPSAGEDSEAVTSSGIVSTKTFSVTIYANKGGLEVSGNKVIKATGDDSKSASAAVTFYHRRFWGASADANADITTLSSELSNAKGKTITYDCSGGKYFYYAYPTSLGKASFNIGGLAVGIEPTTTKITNAYGKEIEYYVYRSAEKQTGSAIKVIIS